MKFTLAGTNFSSLGLGNVNWAYGWLDTVGITDAGQRTAFLNFNNSLTTANLWPFIDAFFPFAGSNNVSQSYVFESAARRLTFAGAPLFAADGFNPNGAGWATFNPAFPAGNISATFSFGVWNATAEVAASGSNFRYLMYYNGANASGVDTLQFHLERNYAPASPYTLGAQFAQPSPVSQLVATAYDNSKTGFLQFVKDSGANNLLDNGASIVGTNSNTTAPTGGGATKVLNIGGSGFAGGASSCKLKCAYLGRLTVAQAITFNGIVTTLMTALGR